MRISDWSSDVCSSRYRARSPCAARARGWPHRAAPRRPRCWLRGSLRILLAIMAVIAAEARAAGGERDGVEHQIDVLARVEKLDRLAKLAVTGDRKSTRLNSRP